MIENLADQLRNITSHVLGDLSNCPKYGFDCHVKKNKVETNFMPTLKTTSLYEALTENMKDLVKHCKSLMRDQTNSPAELFHSLMCATIQSKRVSGAQRLHYPLRCNIAAVQYDTKEVLSAILRNMGKRTPATLRTIERRRMKKTARDKQARREKRWKPLIKRMKMTLDKHCGPYYRKSDMTKQEFEKARIALQTELKGHQENRAQSEKDMVGQRQCSEWRDIHSKTLSASNFALAAKWVTTTSCANRVKQILYPPKDQDDEPAVKYGREQEEVLKKKLKGEYLDEMQECGVFTHETYEFLICSPDATFGNDV
ncbi:hypothetical protein QAD02_000757 [Eretmocerus hayati]|uniref:Uncharacterized protein n=1 Tax=Eretmocerus hayati TaxID=131215 RepID=A0ACC2NFD1_9HYME|nr:hypothetical protein QAD02_000757 [Eretmocerus hayati]